uniref:SERRATE/Ars2 C-terminal domain-containing protein n=1 Tax=Periophthalmus magnuspinnatus TaxID=409849 RepID=A0A3B3ZY60_9GOBI
MPHRCGLMHVRGPLPVGKITAAEVSEHLKMCDQRMAPLLCLSETVSEEEAARLGKKDPEQEVEKFLTANTQELSKDKWLCPLSGKKFKAPEFVRKHILNKHGEKVATVRQEVQFFNNFLLDPKRPALPENKPLPPPGDAPPTAIQPFPGQSPQQQSILGYPPGVRPPMPGFPGKVSLFTVVVSILKNLKHFCTSLHHCTNYTYTVKFYLYSRNKNQVLMI